MGFAIGELIIYLVIALLLGLAVGYLLWFRQGRTSAAGAAQTRNELTVRSNELSDERGLAGSLRAKLVETSGSLAELETSYRAMTDERDELNSELAAVRAASHDFEDHNSKLQVEVQGLTTSMGERDASLAESAAQVRRVSAELGSIKGKITGLQADVDTERERATTLSAQLTSMTGEHDTRAAQLMSLTGEVDTERSARAQAALELDAEKANVVKLVSEITDARGDMASAQDANTALAVELSEARGDMASAQDANTALARELSEALKATQECAANCADLEAQLAQARTEVVQAPLLAAVPELDSNPESSEADTDSVAAAVAAGTASFLGPEPVEELRANPDQLQRVKGIGPYLEKLLNRNGIYTFRQIARLSPDGLRDLDTQLESFKGRIGRDDWLVQASKLHTEKYGNE